MTSASQDAVAPAAGADPSVAPITVGIPPASTADDAKFVSQLASIVNEVYTWAEQGIFTPDYQRTNTDEVADLIRTGQLAVARLGADGDGEPLGCVFIKKLSPTRRECGMLALTAAHRGGGLGRKMALFAEERCREEGCVTLQVELLVPTTFRHPFKERLQASYLEHGFKIVKLGSFDQEYPSLAKQLAGPAEYRIFEKSLV